MKAEAHSGTENGAKDNLLKPVIHPREADGSAAIESMARPRDSQLLERYQIRGEEGAFTALVERYQKMVLGAAFRRTGDLAAARRVAELVFAALARKACFLMNRPSLAGWLHQATVYESVRAVRTSASVAAVQLGEAHPSALPHSRSQVSGPERWSDLEECIDSLPADLREILVLRYFQDLSYPEIAFALELSEAIARKRLFSAVEHLGLRLRIRGIGGNVAALLAGAVAMQSLLLAPSGLAQAALAAAAAGAGSSAFLTVAAILSNATVRTVALILAFGTLPLVWKVTTSVPVGSASPPASIPAIRPPPADRNQTAAPAPLLAKESVTDVLPSATPASLESPQPSYRFAPPAAAASFTTAAQRPAGASRIQEWPSDRDGRVSAVGSLPSGDASAQGEPGIFVSLMTGLREVELRPPAAAAFFSDVLGEVLVLNPDERSQVQDTLNEQFQWLNGIRLAGPRPDPISELEWIAQRVPAITRVVEAVQETLPQAAADRHILTALFSLADTAAATATALSSIASPVPIVASTAATLAVSAASLTMPAPSSLGESLSSPSPASALPALRAAAPETVSLSDDTVAMDVLSARVGSKVIAAVLDRLPRRLP